MFHLFIHLSITNNFVHSFLRSIQYFFSIFKSNLLPPFLLYILFILHAKYFPSLFIVLLHASVPPFSVPCLQLRFAINSTSFLHLFSILILIYFKSNVLLFYFNLEIKKLLTILNFLLFIFIRTLTTSGYNWWQQYSVKQGQTIHPSREVSFVIRHKPLQSQSAELIRRQNIFSSSLNRLSKCPSFVFQIVDRFHQIRRLSA